MTSRVVVSTRGPLAVGSVLFRDLRGQSVCTVVAKATYRLTPGLVEPTAEPLPLQATDLHWDDDPTRGVQIPSDMAPFKDAPEVVLIGAAFAPNGQVLTSVNARLVVAAVDKTIEAHGPRFLMPSDELGPVPVSSRRRSGGLRPTDRAWLDAPADLPLPNEFPVRYFQSAPTDQRLGRPLERNERIELEHLHQQHPRLAMNLGGLEPYAIVPGRAEALRLRGDLLLIDTERAVCTLTFRGHVVMTDATEALHVEVVSNLPVTLHVADKNEAGTLSHGGAERATGRLSEDPLETTSFSCDDGSGDMLPFIPRVDSRPSMHAPPAPVSWTGVLAGALAGSAADSSPSTSPLASNGALAQAAIGKPQSLLAGLRVGDAMKAAAAAAPIDASDAPLRAVRRHSVVDLVSFEPTTAARLRELKRLHPVFATARKPRGPLQPDEPQRPAVDPDRDTVLRALSCGEPQTAAELRRALTASLDDLSDLEPPLILCAGELSPSFDELEALRATVAVAASVAGTDKRVLETVAVAVEALAASLPPSPETLRNLARQIETASTTLAIAPRFIATHVERVLIEGRKYKRRTLFGSPRIRAELTLPSAEVFPLYLSNHVADFLPLLQSFPVVVVCEVRPREDLAEAIPEALLCVALGRVLRGKPS